MTKPPPEAGLVIRYDYLWRREAGAGQQEGAKFRPCVVVVGSGTAAGRAFALVAPVTHTPPDDVTTAVPLPLPVKRHLGLDEMPSWVIVSELNRIDWGDAGLVPVASGRWAYGHLPPGLVRQIIEKVRAGLKAHQLALVRRDVI